MRGHPSIAMLMPGDLPLQRVEVRQAFASHAMQTLTNLTRHTSLLPEDNALSLVREALDMIPEPPGVVPANYDGLYETLPRERYQEHDEYFGIIRKSGESVPLFVRSLLTAYQELLEEAAATDTFLNPDEWLRLRTAFESTLHYLADRPALPVPATLHGSVPAPVTAPGSMDPIRRWRIGHHVFLALIQSLVVSLNFFSNAVHSGALSEAGTALELAIRLMCGSASALRFAGGFPANQYEDLVRPAMMPPNVDPGFSGVQSADHQVMVRTFQKLGACFATLDPSLHPQRQQLHQALGAAYDAHKFVCAQFQGDRVSSLRMNSESERSAVDVLEHLKQVRLRSMKM